MMSGAIETVDLLENLEFEIWDVDSKNRKTQMMTLQDQVR